MDKSVADKVTGNDNDLANSLITDTINYSLADLANLANNLQPLLSGSVNRIVADSSHGFGNAVFERTLDPNRTIWAKAIGNNTSLDQHGSGLTGFDGNETGVIVGTDTAIGSSSLGLAVAYSQNNIDSKGFAITISKLIPSWVLPMAITIWIKQPLTLTLVQGWQILMASVALLSQV
ncbi:autotransporter domain-containing protein [Moraxella lacunata]|uniref:autotransporter domain-containing protein n=1 Tax=Moraxella lacunata TaxID=477 RepID=UPI0007841E26|nr:autotransporter domain-containing protein [Moraxella lacunata]